MKIVKKNDGRVTTKAIKISIERIVYIGFQISNKKKDWWDNKFISYTVNKGEKSNGFGVSLMRVSFFVTWTI